MKKDLPRCTRTKCDGKLKKHQPLVNTRVYVCVKCGRFHHLEKRVGCGYNYM